MFFIKFLIFSIFFLLLLKKNEINEYYLTIMFFPVLINTYFLNNLFVITNRFTRNLFFVRSIVISIFKIYFYFYLLLILLDFTLSVIMIKMINLICYNYTVILNFNYFLHYFVSSICLFILGLLFSYNLSISIKKGIGKQNTTNFLASILTLSIIFLFSYSYLNFKIFMNVKKANSRKLS